MNDDRRPAPDDAPPAEEGAADLLEMVLAEHDARGVDAAPARIDGVVVGTLAALGASGEALVDFPDRPGVAPIAARSMTALGPTHVGRAVAILFESGDPARPVVMGLMHAPAPAPRPAVEADGDGERLVFTAEKEIVLRCGEASITLTRAGKILIKGAYVLSRATGLQRIQGGAVEIN